MAMLRLQQITAHSFYYYTLSSFPVEDEQEVSGNHVQYQKRRTTHRPLNADLSKDTSNYSWTAISLLVVYLSISNCQKLFSQSLQTEGNHEEVIIWSDIIDCSALVVVSSNVVDAGVLWHSFQAFLFQRRHSVFHRCKSQFSDCIYFRRTWKRIYCSLCSWRDQERRKHVY